MQLDERRHPEANSLQEGNDVYLSCQLDANPRPSKPIAWRFNGRRLAPSPANSADGQAAAAAATLLQSEASASLQPTAGASQQQQQPAAATIVISSQSLVLRKVSRHQSGAYACEASNQHGTNSSRPFALTIRHAPVCATDDM